MKLYQHYKGGLYEFICESCMEADGTLMITYKALSDDSIWTRTSLEFFSGVMHKCQLVPRFKELNLQELLILATKKEAQ